MKVIADENIPFLRGRLEAIGAEVTYVDQFGFTPDLVRDADILLIRTRTRCNSALLEGSKVKLVATATIGTDQIDMEWCRDAGIIVRNAPGCNAPGVAQYVWSSLLRLGFDPGRHTLGIVGCGNVGKIVRQWGETMGAHIIINDPPLQHMGILDTYAPLDELLAECDAVTLHTPLTKTGRYPSFHLIGDAELSLMKDNAILVNAARGPVVDNAALKSHLASGRLRAVIDTWEFEPRVDTDILDMVEYGTFHIAGYSLQGKQRATRMALEAVEEVFGLEINKEGLEPPYMADPDISAERIIDSYDPIYDTLALREAPEAFDRLRHDYNFRNEP
ncbi:MAG: 4-phosphoerythronate dehydrogenase [Lepagella sp.]